jgi:hypothetical protein
LRQLDYVAGWALRLEERVGDGSAAVSVQEFDEFRGVGWSAARQRRDHLLLRRAPRLTRLVGEVAELLHPFVKRLGHTLAKRHGIGLDQSVAGVELWRHRARPGGKLTFC